MSGTLLPLDPRPKGHAMLRVITGNSRVQIILCSFTTRQTGANLIYFVPRRGSR